MMAPQITMGQIADIQLSKPGKLESGLALCG